MTENPFEFDSIARSNLSSQVAETIKERVELGRIAPHTKLPSERELCEAFSVSRVSIREAIQLLMAQGYVEILPGKGTFVLDPDTRNKASLKSWISSRDQDLELMIEMRMMIEPGIAALAAEKASKQDAEALLKLAESLRECPRSELSETDAQFHRMIAAMTGNPLISELVAPCLGATEPLRNRTLQDRQRRELAADGHVRIAEAIASGDNNRARSAMLSHLEDAKDSL